MDQSEMKTIQASLDTLLGKTEDEVTAELEEAGWSVRVTGRDGEEFMRTMDYRTDRANLHVTNGKVTNISVG